MLLSNYLVLPFSIAYNLLSKKILGALAPKLTSDALLAGSVFKYFDISFFPFVSSLSREIPLYREKNPLYAKKIADVVFSVSLILSSFAFIVFSILGFLTDDFILKLVYYAFGLSSVFKFLHRTINVYLSSYGQFIRKSKISIWVVLIKVPISLTLIYYFKEYGYVISIFLTASLTGAFFIFLMDWKLINFTIDRSLIKLLLIRSLPFTLYMGIETILFSFDKFLIRSISPIELGIYGFAFQVSLMIYETPKQIYSTLFPYFLRDLSAAELPDIFSNIINIQRKILILTTALIIISYTFFVIIVRYFLPHFSGAEKFASILFAIPYVYSFNYVFYVYCISKRYDKELSIISITSICLSIVLFLLAYLFDFNSFHISIIVVGVFSFNSFLIAIFLFSKYKIGSKYIARIVGATLLIFFPQIIVSLPYYLTTQYVYFNDISFGVLQIIFLVLASLVLIVFTRIIDPDFPSFIIKKLRSSFITNK